MYLFSLTKNDSKKQFFFTITIIETNSLQLQQSEMSTYLNNFYSSFPEKEHKSKSHLLKKKKQTLHLLLHDVDHMFLLWLNV